MTIIFLTHSDTLVVKNILIVILGLYFRRMSRQRVAVEWSIGRIKNLFKMLTYKVKSIQNRIYVYTYLVKSSEKLESPYEPSCHLLLPCNALDQHQLYSL